MSVAAADPRGFLAHPRLPLLLWLGAGVTAVALFVAAGLVGLPEGPGFIVCAFRRLTGIPCPGCGLTRAMAALARGELLLALHFHPFAPLVLAEAGALWAGIGASVLGRPLQLPPRFLERVVVWQTAAFVALWLGRLATGTLPW